MPKRSASTGLRAHLAGASAEAQAARVYESQGYTLEALRWRGQGGEIDLILRQGKLLVFVEVKTGPSIAAAATRISARQMQRIQASAALYLEQEPAGALTEARIDAALVSQSGEVEILENAYGQG